MTNEEMIKEMVRDYVPTLENCDHSLVLREALTEMAKWKDEKFDAFLDWLIVLGNKDVIEAICDHRGEKLEE